MAIGLANEGGLCSLVGLSHSAEFGESSDLTRATEAVLDDCVAQLRSLELPGEVDEKKVNAEYRDGILKIHLPKSPETQPRLIDVKVG